MLLPDLIDTCRHEPVPDFYTHTPDILNMLLLSCSSVDSSSNSLQSSWHGLLSGLLYYIQK
jgi:hypothetical protein